MVARGRDSQACACSTLRRQGDQLPCGQRRRAQPRPGQAEHGQARFGAHDGRMRQPKGIGKPPELAASAAVAERRHCAGLVPMHDEHRDRLPNEPVALTQHIATIVTRLDLSIARFCMVANLQLNRAHSLRRSSKAESRICPCRSDAETDLARQAIASCRVMSFFPFGSSIGSPNLRVPGH